MSLGEFIPSSSTKLCLHLNGNSNDSSSSGNNGTDTAITYSQANGKFGQGAGFTTSRIQLPAKLPLLNTACTVSLMVKTTDANFSCILSNSVLSTAGNGLFICNNGDGKVYIGCSRGTAGTTNFDLYSSATTLLDGNWHSIIFTWDLSTNANQVKLYFDNILTTTTALSSSITPGYNTRIGYRPESEATEFKFVGSIDEVIIENRIWSAQEVAKYYTYAKGRFGII